MIKIFNALLKNGIVPFVGVKYASLGLSFIATLLIASKLAPFYFGIWGFILLIQQYLTYSNFGVNYSLNAILSTNFEKEDEYKRKLFHNTLFLTLFISLFVLLLWIGYYFWPTDIFGKYNFKEYSLYLLIFISFENLNQIFINVYRIYNKLLLVGLAQLFVALSKLIPVLLLDGEALIYGLLVFQIIFSSLSLVVFCWNSPLKLGLSFNLNTSSLLLKRGVSLLFYNISFYFILMTTKSLISALYSVEMYGEFSFSLKLASIAHLGMNTISFLFFPKFLNRLKKDRATSEILNNLDNIKNVYSTLYFIITLLLVALVPLIDLMFPDYKEIKRLMIVILLLNLGLSIKAGHNSLLISWGKEIAITVIGFVIIVLNMGLIFIIYYFVKDIYIVLLSTVVSGFLYSYLVIIWGERVLGEKRGIMNSKIFVKYGLPLIVTLSIAYLHSAFYVVPLFIYLILNRRNVMTVCKKCLSLLKNKEALSL
ncbi:lipopolysaccharide biosynthesis protein [Rhodohalobacter mucosus]|uniref:O-antigen/teichoic acid export membrane protein n=1 Tax=Rhodohalobacter mucosus TaxID=2079485 RepID=A0A316TXQ2_9BACT|nr:hypothetical protein [Rhodohalobacter mucosus]PWN07462.1 hypothetical protein DDZ15_04150 [Rhodohalobacter mucosus]